MTDQIRAPWTPEQVAPDLARLRRLRDQLAAEHAKAVRADQHPRPDLDHLRVTAPNGKAVGLETALFFIDHHLREAGEARTTADNGAASGELRDRIAAALHSWLNEPDEAKAWDEMAAEAADVVLIALEQHLDIGEEQAWCKICRRVWEGKAHRCESDAEQQAAGFRAAAIRDQAALAQIRLYVAAYRQRLRLADPVLLGKLDGVLRTVGELEAAGGEKA